MKKHGKISKGILILIIVICVLAVLVASAVGVYFFDKQNKINQEKILDDVANSMYTSSNFDSETKTTGKFAIVENALKEYYTEYLNTSNDLVSIYSKNSLYEISASLSPWLNLKRFLSPKSSAPRT